jgi:hypothetical protein
VVHRQIVTQAPAPMIKVGFPAKRSIVEFSMQEKSEVLERSATVEIKAKRTELGYSDLEPSKVSLVPHVRPQRNASNCGSRTRSFSKYCKTNSLQMGGKIEFP